MTPSTQIILQFSMRTVLLEIDAVFIERVRISRVAVSFKYVGWCSEPMGKDDFANP